MELKSNPLTFMLRGQMPSGKNQINIRFFRGRIMKYPNAKFKKWRADAYNQLSSQGYGRHTITAPCAVFVRYTPGDKIRRDVPGIMDALCHLLEWCPEHGRKKTNQCFERTVADDALLEHWTFQRMPMNKTDPKIEVEISGVVTEL